MCRAQNESRPKAITSVWILIMLYRSVKVHNNNSMMDFSKRLREKVRRNSTTWSSVLCKHLSKGAKVKCIPPRGYLREHFWQRGLLWCPSQDTQACCVSCVVHKSRFRRFCGIKTRVCYPGGSWMNGFFVLRKTLEILDLSLRDKSRTKGQMRYKKISPLALEHFMW